MGVDKLDLVRDWQPGGVSVSERVVSAALRAGAAEVLLVGGSPDRPRSFRAVSPDVPLRWIPDLAPGEGPLGAVISALSESICELVVVLAGDLAEPQASVMAWLVQTAGDHVERSAPDAEGFDVLVPRRWVDGQRRVEVLQACYRKSALPKFEVAFRAGERSILRALRTTSVRYVDVEDGPAWSDLDTPEDVERWRTGPEQSGLASPE